MYCNNCNSQVPDGAVCSNCGAAATDNVPQMPQFEYQYPEQQSQHGYIHPELHPHSDYQSQYLYSQHWDQQIHYQPPPEYQPRYQPPPPGYQPPPPEYQPPNPYLQPGYQQPYARVQQPYPPGYQAQYPVHKPIPPYDPTRFSQLLHSFGSSPLYLIGIIIFSVGSLFSAVATFNIFSILSLILIALPIIGFWMIYFASKFPRLPDRALPAITLFKTSVIINLVAECLVMFILLILSIFFFIAAAAIGSSFYSSMDFGPAVFTALGVVILIATVMALILVIFYFRSILRVLNGIRNGVTGGPVFELPGIKAFTVFICIFTGVSLFSALIYVVAYPIIFGDSISNMYSTLYSLPYEFRRFIEPFVTSMELRVVLSSISSFVTNVGSIILVIVLNRFNNKLKSGQSLTDY